MVARRADLTSLMHYARRFGRAILNVGGIVGFVCMASWAMLYWQSGTHRQTVRIILPHGSSLVQITHQLDEAGVLTSPFVFYATMRLGNVAARFQAGEYDIAAGATMAQIAKMLIKGAGVLHPITIAEGLTSQQIIALLRATPILQGKVEVPPEGSLLPETYLVARNMSRTALVAQMQAAQSRLMATLWPQRAKNLPIHSQREAIILASIIERETGRAGERALVAAVFINRLNKKMRLQSDPTIIYGLVGGKGKLGRPIRRSEIRRKTAYNTYRINGLPPTPIANPGAAALAAVLNPATSDALYFVADGAGGHVFANNLKAHSRNVQNWRQRKNNTN